MHSDRGCPRWRNSWSQSVYAQGWQHGRASHFQQGHEQCEYCFCIFTCPVTGLHHCYGWWKIQSEAVWVACMTKMFFFFQKAPLCCLINILSVLLHCGAPTSIWDVSCGKSTTDICFPFALYDRWYVSCGPPQYEVLGMQLTGTGIWPVL